VLLFLRSKQVPEQHDCPAGHERPHCPQFAMLVLRLTQVPLQPVKPVPQQVPLEQLPFAHCEVLVHELPSLSLVTHWLVLQYLFELAQLVCDAAVHAPAPLHTVALLRVVTLAQVASVHTVSEALYTHASDVPSQVPAQVALVAVHGVWPGRGGPVMRVQDPAALHAWH